MPSSFRLDLETQLAVLASISQRESASLLNNMSPDDRTTLLAELSPEQSDRLIALLNPDQREVARTLLNCEEVSVGRLMTPDYIAVRKDWTIRHVLDHVRSHGRDSETLNVIYVLDGEHRLFDDLRISEVLLAPFHAMAGGETRATHSAFGYSGNLDALGRTYSIPEPLRGRLEGGAAAQPSAQPAAAVPTRSNGRPVPPTGRGRP